MDEHLLNELLECSVCLEHMDTSSKVLPCQHTFHRRCLENIIGTKGELRCPECRTIVETRVDDLPPNILLMRLLETMKTASVGGASSSTSYSGPMFTIAQHNVKSTTVTGGKPTTIPTEPCARALYNYEAKEPGDLSFKKGDLVLLRKKVDENWYHGELNGQHGFFPASYVQVINLLPDNTPRCKALYDFEIDDSEKDCLTFQKDEVLTVIRRVDSNWVEGKLGDKIGIFPISFVEMNEPAKHLINTGPVFINNNFPLRSGPVTGSGGGVGPPQQPGSPATGSPPPAANVTSSSPSQALTGAANAQITPTGSPVIGGSARGNATPSNASGVPSQTVHKSQKRHSLTTLSTNHYSPPLHQRHSMDVTTHASLGTLSVHVPASPPIPAHAVPITQQVFSHTASAIPATCTTVSSVSVTTTVSSQPLPATVGLNIFVALYNYKPQKEDEVELKKGDYYTVTERCQDGWCKGMCYRSGKVGVFPGNYVQQVKITQTCPKLSQVFPGTSSVMNVRAVGPAALATSNITVPAVTTSPCLPISSLTSIEYKVRPGVSAVPPSISFPSSIAPTTPVPTSHINTQAMTVAQAQQLRTHFMHPVQSASFLCGSNSVQTSVSLVAANATAPVNVNVTAGINHQSNQNDTKGHFLPKNGVAVPPRWVPPIPSRTMFHHSIPASENITPPNVVTGAASSAVLGAAVSTQAKDKREKKDKDREREKVSLMKRMTSGKTKKSARVPPPSIDSLAAGETVSISVLSVAGADAGHARTSSLPVNDEIASKTQHKKSASLDSTNPTNQPSHTVQLKPGRPKQPGERCRCITPFPPNSDHELELRIGDIVYVHRKRDDGWYKGILARTGKTGLFPGSFVEVCR